MSRTAGDYCDWSLAFMQHHKPRHALLRHTSAPRSALATTAPSFDVATVASTGWPPPRHCRHRSCHAFGQPFTPPCSTRQMLCLSLDEPIPFRSDAVSARIRSLTLSGVRTETAYKSMLRPVWYCTDTCVLIPRSSAVHAAPTRQTCLPLRFRNLASHSNSKNLV